VTRPRVGDGQPRQLGGGRLARESRRLYLDHLRRATRVERVRDPDPDSGPFAAGGGGDEHDEAKGGDESHRSFSGEGRGR